MVYIELTGGNRMAKRKDVNRNKGILICLTQGEKDYLLKATYADNLTTLSPWIRQQAMKNAEKILGTMPTTTTEPETVQPCVNTPKVQDSAVNDAPKSSNEWPN
jgi:hypothetical protein